MVDTMKKRMLDEWRRWDEQASNYSNVGGFRSHLFKTIRLADLENLRKLRTGFPLEVEAYLEYTGITLKQGAD